MVKKILQAFIVSLLIGCGGQSQDHSSNAGATSDLQTFLQSFLSPKSNSKYDFVIENSCGFDYKLINQKVYSFDSDIEAEDALKRIMRLTGLPPNFKIRSASVNNACAVIKCDDAGNCDRYILYNQEFMERVKDQTNTNYSELAILAHEIAHHMAGHTLTNIGSSYDMELEADKFAGFILFKLGASFEDAKLAYSHLSPEGSSTHPPREARIAALSNGFFEAKRSGGQIVNSPKDEEVDSYPKSENSKERMLSEGDKARLQVLKRYAALSQNNSQTPTLELLAILGLTPIIYKKQIEECEIEPWPVYKNRSQSGEILFNLENVVSVIKICNSFWTFDGSNRLIGGNSGNTVLLGHSTGGGDRLINGYVLINSDLYY